MNAEQFLEIIQHGNALHQEEISKLLILHESFPYFQIPKVLLAKHEFEHSGGKETHFLHWAAITSPDRVWLQSLVETKKPLEILERELILKKQESESTSPEKISPLGSEGLLETGKSLLSNEMTTTNPQEITEEIKNPEETLNPTKVQIDTKETETNEQLLSKRKSLENDDGEELIENLRKMGEKEIIDEKQKEQIDLIEKFHNRDFKLASLKEMANFQKQEDLSKESTKINNEVISESFAILLINQGKKQKAIEIYRKLMVKFPEKSAYFTELLNTIEDKI